MITLIIYSVLTTTTIFTYILFKIYKKTRNGTIKLSPKKVANIMNLFFASVFIYIPVIVYYEFTHESNQVMKDEYGIKLVILILVISILIRLLCYYITEKIIGVQLDNLKDIIFYAYIMNLSVALLSVKDKEFIMTLVVILLGKFIWFDSFTWDIDEKIKPKLIMIKVKDKIIRTKNNEVFKESICLLILWCIMQVTIPNITCIFIIIFISMILSMIISVIIVNKMEISNE